MTKDVMIFQYFCSSVWVLHHSLTDAVAVVQHKVQVVHPGKWQAGVHRVFQCCKTCWSSGTGRRSQICNGSFHAFSAGNQLDYASFWCVWSVGDEGSEVRKLNYLQHRCPQLCVGGSLHALWSWNGREVLCKWNKKKKKGERAVGLQGIWRGSLLCTLLWGSRAARGCLLCTPDPFISLGSNWVRAAVLPCSLPGADPNPEKKVHVYGRKSFSLPFLSLLRLLAKLCDSYLVSAEPWSEVIQEV